MRMNEKHIENLVRLCIVSFNGYFSIIKIGSKNILNL